MAKVFLFFLLSSSVLYGQTTILFENFDGTPSNTHALPPGWSTTTNRLANGDWWDTTFAGNSPPNVCYNINATIEQILTTPAISFSTYTADSVIFYARKSGTFNAKITIEVSTDNGSSWTIVGTPNNPPSDTIPNSMKRFAYSIPSLVNGQANVKFRYRNHGNGTGTGGTTRLDDFTVRAFTTGDGSGTATITPTSRFVNQSAVAETLVVTGDGTNTLEGVSVTIPSNWTWDGTSRTISGAGFSSASSSVSGDGSGGNPWVITITGAAVTNTNTGTVILSNLGTPASTGLTTFTVKTRIASGTLIPILNSPTVNILSGVGFEAVATGNWSSTSTWSGGVVPGPNDDVTMTTLNVIVTIDVTNAQCRNLTMTGSGNASNSGPMLQFMSTGSPQLTVNGDLSISGGSGSTGDRAGRPKLHSNGNPNATLIVYGDIVSTSSNQPSNGDAGLNMNEGTIKLVGATTDTLKNGASVRMGHLIIGDGTNPKTLVCAPTTSATIRIKSLTVKSGSTFWIGSANNATPSDIGNSVVAGIPMLDGGITVEAGAALRVLDFSGGVNVANINLDGGGITNNGTIDLRVGAFKNKTNLTGCIYNVNIGGLSAGSSSSNQTISGSQVGDFANITVAAGHTLTLQQDVNIPPYYKLTLDGTLVETPGNTIIGPVEATRTMAQGVAEDFGGIGITLNAAGAAPGSVLVRRVSGPDAVQSGGGNNSIARYFDITAAVNNGLNASLDFKYDNSELNGQSASTLSLWRSDDNGVLWDFVGGTVDTSTHTIHAVGINSFSRWTAADADNSLGGTTATYSFLQGWNMISVPLIVADYRKSVLFPSVGSNVAYAFENGYVQKDTLKNGVGYWLKFPASEEVGFNGVERNQDSIAVIAGWNMIGVLSSPALASAVTSNPEGIRLSGFFGYRNGYYEADTLEPAKGYWVKVSDNGKLFVSNTGLSVSETSSKAILQLLNTITISDDEGNAQTLYFGKDDEHKITLSNYEMPPAPPAGIFDARFASGRMLETYSSHQQKKALPLQLQTTSSLVKIQWSVITDDAEKDYRLVVRNKEVTINGSGEMTIESRDVKTMLLLILPKEQPKEFSLMQNYPNPFNPSTRITFAVPSTATVEISVYTVLGEKVTTLVHEEKSAGVYSVEWNGMNQQNQHMASGVYYVRMKANDFVGMKKMLLMK